MTDYKFEVFEDETGEMFASGECNNEHICFSEGMRYLHNAGPGHALRLWKSNGEISLDSVTREPLQ